MLTKKQVKEIKEHLERAQNPLFLFDNDNDGLCSFLLLQRYIGRGKGFPVKTAPELAKDYFRKVRELAPDYIFILDQPEVSKDFLDEVHKLNIPVVWIDHHITNKKKIPSWVCYYNPLFNKLKTEEPVTTLCYQITERKEDIWIAVIGSISDKFVPIFYSNFRKKFYDLAIDSNDAFEIYYDSGIGKIAQMLSFDLMDRTTNVINMIKFLEKAKSPYDVLEENPKTKLMHIRFNELLKKENKLLKRAKQEAMRSEKIVFFQYSGDTGMSANLSNRLSYLFPKKIIVVIRIIGIKANLSLRGRNIREKVLEIIKNIEGATGGGHEDAVGVQMNKDHLEDFKKRLIELIL